MVLYNRSDGLLPQAGWDNGESSLHNDNRITLCIANGSHLSRSSKNQPFTVVESFVNLCIKR